MSPIIAAHVIYAIWVPYAMPWNFQINVYRCDIVQSSDHRPQQIYTHYTDGFVLISMNLAGVNSEYKSAEFCDSADDLIHC